MRRNLNLGLHVNPLHSLPGNVLKVNPREISWEIIVFYILNKMSVIRLSNRLYKRHTLFAIGYFKCFQLQIGYDTYHSILNTNRLYIGPNGNTATVKSFHLTNVAGKHIFV